MKSTHTVFVYGTLKAGQHNHSLLKGAAFIGKGITIKPFLMLSTGGFPVVFDHERRHNVHGELYDVDFATLAQLDGLEGHPNWYCRKETVVDVADTGVNHTAWMYIGVLKAWDRQIPYLAPVHANAIGAYCWSRQ